MIDHDIFPAHGASMISDHQMRDWETLLDWGGNTSSKRTKLLEIFITLHHARF